MPRATSPSTTARSISAFTNAQAASQPSASGSAAAVSRVSKYLIS